MPKPVVTNKKGSNCSEEKSNQGQLGPPGKIPNSLPSGISSFNFQYLSCTPAALGGSVV